MEELNQSASSAQSNTPKKADESSGMSIPQTRIRAIMRSSPDSLQISQEALFAMSKATEFFIIQVAKGAFDKSDGKSLDYAELASFVQSNEEMEFLHEIIPKKVKASEVWHLLERNT
uniref:Transcription factor CBF/NF-Y/archaeal histone domain-containing protein n=1 Tax=Plectus sambesii TaxID=2011161 RepID=A0A914XLF1_9BILA